MSISPAVIALRTTGVPPSWMRSVVLMPLAFSTSGMMLPSTPPSVSIFEETTTWALAEAAVMPSANAALARTLTENIVKTSCFEPECGGRI